MYINGHLFCPTQGLPKVLARCRQGAGKVLARCWQGVGKLKGVVWAWVEYDNTMRTLWVELMKGECNWERSLNMIHFGNCLKKQQMNFSSS